ncbi:MAG TPA: cell envelope integrity protein TolA [Paucimonas sp.]|nr:cell envelope integrity protein TolA [Paucimonas sp.]
MTAIMQATPYQVPKEPGRWRALALAATVHAMLLALLWVGVRWQNEVPIAVEAEVWSPQIREAAPPPLPEREIKPEPEVKPPPKPVDEPPPVAKPDIALEQEKKRKEAREKEERKRQEQLEKARAEELAKKEAADKKRKELAEQQRLEKARQETLQRMLAQAGPGGSGDAPQTQGPRGNAEYLGRVAAKIKSNTVFPVPDNLAGNPAVEYAVDLLPDGSIRRPIRKIRPSGVPGFDDAVLNAIEKSQPFPPDKSGKVPSGFNIVHRPKDQ